MKFLFSVASTAAAALCLILGIWLFSVSGENRSLQKRLQEVQQLTQAQQRTLQQQQQQLQLQQEQINTGSAISQQIGPALLRDLAAASISNDKIEKLLADHGYNVEHTPSQPNPAP